MSEPHIPEKLEALARELSSPLYVVGGACRDALASLSPTCRNDWDICAPVSAEKVAEAAGKAGVCVTAAYKNTGTVRMEADGEEYEFTSFRSDRYVRGMHRPEEVFFTDDIQKDARRRDFKCNAVYYDIVRGQFVDPLGGIEDIAAKRITCVAPAVKVFGEDGLRLMRLARIAAQTGFSPTEECVSGAYENRALIADIAAERIFSELSAMLSADLKYGISGGHYRGLEILKDIGALSLVLPELGLGDGMEQRADFHNYDVLEHSLRCVLYSPPQIRLAALLHDVGKPYCRLNFGSSAFHAEYGEKISGEICERLRVPKKLARRVEKLVRFHMYDFDCKAAEKKVRRFYVDNSDIWDDLLLLKQADFSACKDDLSVAPSVAKWREIENKVKSEGVPVKKSQLAVNGAQLIGAGISPDETGDTLNYLLRMAVCGNVENTYDKLIACARGYVRGRHKINLSKL